MSEILYPYALDEQNKLVFIKDAQRSQFHCIECSCEMIPRQGNIRVWHFAHKNEGQACSGEGALHKTAKLLLEKRWKDKTFPILTIQRPVAALTPIESAYKWPMSPPFMPEPYEWMPIGDISVERPFLSIKPDVSFWNQERLISCIEVVVSHYPDAETKKIYRTHKIPVYLWKIESFGDILSNFKEVKPGTGGLMDNECYGNLYELMPCRIANQIRGIK